jgi:hypothetical protein
MTTNRRKVKELAISTRLGLRGLVSTLCGACIVTFVALGFGAAPARAQSFTPLPPQVAFISNGKYTGTLETQGMTLPITGTVAYLTGQINYLKISVDTGGQQITSNSWVITTPTVINKWEIVSTHPTTCRTKVLSGDSYPQCTAWSETNGIWSRECTVTAQGNKTTLNFLARLSPNNQLVSLQEIATLGENDNSQGNETDLVDSVTITMTSQGTTPPVPSDFNRPSICNAPSGNIADPLIPPFPELSNAQ